MEQQHRILQLTEHFTLYHSSHVSRYLHLFKYLIEFHRRLLRAVRSGMVVDQNVIVLMIFEVAIPGLYIGRTLHIGDQGNAQALPRLRSEVSHIIIGDGRVSCGVRIVLE